MPENSLFKTALSKAMAQCSRREFCKDDIRNKLQTWNIGDNDIEKIIEILINEKFIDENRYARAFVRDKFTYNKWGKIKIAAHLKIKRIPSEIIKTALDSIDIDVYTKCISELIASHRRSVKSKNQYDLKAKLMRYGLSKGFESSTLYNLLNDIEE
jgi:regulatory protein